MSSPDPVARYGVYREGFEEATRLELEWFTRHLQQPAAVKLPANNAKP